MGAAARFLGHGYAAEIGRAGLEFAFGVLGAQAVVSCTVRHNLRSRAVMERIGMRYAGEIRSRGQVEGMAAEQDDAPFAVCVLLRRDWIELSSRPVRDQQWRQSR
jgi:[ribosomal protein S5]-alanine N-acetyltransferase